MTPLSFGTCANPGCARRVPKSSKIGLCGGCEKHWRRWGVPTGGYIASLDLLNIANQLMREVSPAQSEIAAALRIMRGTRYREGPWEERPPYRLQPLLHGRFNVRLPHLLVGRRKVPTMRGLGMALAHYHLADQVSGTRGSYSQYLAGATFYCRRYVAAPKGADVLTGGAKSAAYRLHTTDFSTIGREVLKAGKALGIDPKSRWAADRITSLYFEGLAAGRYHPVVVLPHGSFPTTAPGDHPLDHRLPTDPAIPPEHRNAIRRASGRIGTQYPVGLDLPWEAQLTHRATQRSAAAPSPYQITRTTEAPDTSWLGF